MSGDARCKRCNGQVFEEDGDVVCLNCGARQVEGLATRAGANGHQESSGFITDPFAQLVTMMQKVQREITRDAEATQTRLQERREQLRRIDAAVRALNGGKSAGRRGALTGAAGATGRQGNGICPECSHGYRSAEHQAHKQPAAEAVA